MGYIRFYSLNGEIEGEYYAGTAISGIDISEDKNKLLAGTKEGMINFK